ncbi:ClpP-like prohead protease/major capsid protein fusion protein [Azospirillum doebereinerae]|uniref:Clp protease ClpP n=1 Tax=Azospirillum doebereinerae TaxID=92933 RepID=A0A433IZF2_9PROT|nr:ClpP-like prohead protease/major capsid protein fusion protein [Azospirillum doebereinerae]RUQ60613.1 Clp protease ClpP [Azospirillum doebereinerae]
MSDRKPRNAVNSDGEVMIYGVVGDEWDGLDAKSVINGIKALGTVDTITLRINSGGGYVYEGLAIFNYLQAHAARKVVHIDGIAASMASVIAMIGDEIHIPANALMMIHNPWNLAIGDASAMRKEADNLDRVKAAIVTIYAARTGKSEAELSALMDAETWLRGQEAVDAGFATTAGAGVEAAALLRNDLSLMNFTNIPDALRRATKPSATAVAALIRAALPAEHTQESSMTVKVEDSAAGTGVDEQKIRAEAQAAERTRASEIRKAVKAARLPDTVADELVDAGTPLDKARETILNTLAEADEQGPQTRNYVRVGADAVDRFRAGAQAALMAKAGLVKDDAGNELRGFSLREMARETLEVHNIATRSMRPLDMVKAAMTHSSGDFTIILANVAEKSMLKGYEEAAETFQQWTATGTLSDFKAASRIDLNTFPSLARVDEGGEYQYATIGERGETVQLATYGNLFSITRQAIINDDMSVFTRIPQRMGRAAVRTVGNLVYAVLTANPAMSDTKALFHADHKNLAAAGGAPSVTTVDAGRVAMATQKDRSANAVALNLRPRYALTPVALEGAFKVLMASEFDPSKTQRTPNSVAGLVEVISDARLDTASTTAWYLAADANATDTVEVSYLDGVSTPWLEQQDGWKVDGVEFKVRLDAAVKALAWEGLYKNVGA